MIEQLEQEKELHENMTETTRDRIEQMKLAIEEIKKENKLLREMKENHVTEINSAKQRIVKLEENCEVLRCEKKGLSEKHAIEISDMLDDFSKGKKQWKEGEMNSENKILELQKTIKDFKGKIEEHIDQNEGLKNNLKKTKMKYESEIVDLQDKYAKEKRELKEDLNNQVKSLNTKTLQNETDKCRLEEEIGRLKSMIMSDKLKNEEDSLTQRGKWKQEEMLKSKQYEDRIDLLVNMKEDLQSKISKLSIQLSETHTQLVSCQKENETCKRQIEQQQQLLNQRDLEYRNENNRIRVEVDGEKRLNTELRNKISNVEGKNQEISSQLRELKSIKDSEIARLQESLKNKEDLVKQIRDEEMRRAGMLETALQTYITSARSNYKS